MRQTKKTAFIAVLGILFPIFSQAQGMAEGMSGMHAVLETLYDQMMPLCSQLIGVGQGIAGFAATWYIGSRVWRHIANAEPIDFYPLFRPFVLGFCIMIFPSVLGLINGIMKPTVTATAAMVSGSNKAIDELLKKKWEAVMKSDPWQMYVGPTGFGDRDKWYKYTHDNADPADESFLSAIGNDIRFELAKGEYNIRNAVKTWLSEVLRVIFEAAALCIDTLRTFQLVVMAILGPIVFGIAVFDGFQHTLTSWLARYMNIFLWLPVANIFGSIIGKVQEEMLKIDIAQVNEYGDTFFSKTDIAYLVFMIIGIIGYFTVPSVANYIVHAGGSALTQKTTSVLSTTSNTIQSGAAASWTTAGTVDQQVTNNFSGAGGSEYMGDKIRGNS